MNPFKKTIISGVLDVRLILPKKYLLFYSRFPNSEDIIWEDDSILEDHMYWGAWRIPRTVIDWTGNTRDMFVILGDGPFFDSLGSSKIVSGSTISSIPNINSQNIIFTWNKGLAIYDPSSVTGSILESAYRFFKV